MKSRKIAYALLASILVLGWGARIVDAEDAPKDNKGYTASKATIVDLGPEFEAMPAASFGCACLQLSRAVTSACIATRTGPPWFISRKGRTRLSATTALRRLFILVTPPEKMAKPFTGTAMTAKTQSS
jgi:hypothetical protein